VIEKWLWIIYMIRFVRIVSVGPMMHGNRLGQFSDRVMMRDRKKHSPSPTKSPTKMPKSIDPPKEDSPNKKKRVANHKPPSFIQFS